MSTPESPRSFVTLAIAADAAAIVVIGGGVVGSRKILSLAGQGARVRVVAPEIADQIKPLHAEGRIEWVPEAYCADHLAGACLVVAATSDPLLNATIAHDARSRGLLVCNASSAADSDVLFPAIHRYDCATIAVHTGGAKPRYAKQLRDEIAARLSEVSGTRACLASGNGGPASGGVGSASSRSSPVLISSHSSPTSKSGAMPITHMPPIHFRTASASEAAELRCRACLARLPRQQVSASGSSADVRPGITGGSHDFSR